MSKPDRVGAVVPRRQGINYRLFLRRLRPELADKILGQHTARTAILERHSGTTPRDAAEQTEDELLIQYGTTAECAAALQRLENRSPLPVQSDDPARVVCCSDQASERPDDYQGEPPLWSADRSTDTRSSADRGAT